MGIDTNPVYLGVDPYPGVTINNGILEFASDQAYEDMIDNLEEKYETHSAAFYDQYDSLTDDEVAALEISQGFDDLKPYKDFEAYFGFNSLRAKVEGEVNVWSAIGEGDYPESNYLTADESEQTLLNVNGQVKISGVIVDMVASTSGGSASCYVDYKKDAWTSGNSINIYEKIWARDDLERFPRRNRTMVKSYKASNNKRYATKMNVSCFGNVYNEFCFGQTPFNSGWKKNTDKRRKRMCLRFWPPTAQQTFICNGTICKGK